MALLVPTAHYTVYSYIEPFLQQVAGLPAEWITLTLTAFGAAGIFGSMLFARYYDRRPARFVAAVVVGIALLLLLLRSAAFDRYVVMALCIVWGIAVTAFNVAFQAETIRYAPEDAAPVAMSIFPVSTTWVSDAVPCSAALFVPICRLRTSGMLAVCWPLLRSSSVCAGCCLF